MTYGYYKSVFGGNIIPPEAFKRYMLRAAAVFSAAIAPNADLSAFKAEKEAAICEIAEALYKFKESDAVLSENTDGYSVSYRKGASARIISEILNNYFGATDALYKGE